MSHILADNSFLEQSDKESLHVLGTESLLANSQQAFLGYLVHTPESQELSPLYRKRKLRHRKIKLLSHEFTAKGYLVKLGFKSRQSV